MGKYIFKQLQLQLPCLLMIFTLVCLQWYNMFKWFLTNITIIFFMCHCYMFYKCSICFKHLCTLHTSFGDTMCFLMFYKITLYSCYIFTLFAFKWFIWLVYSFIYSILFLTLLILESLLPFLFCTLFSISVFA